MGHQAATKLLRKQIRNIAQEKLPGALAQEAYVEFDKRMTERAGARLDEIAKNVDKEVRTMDTQTRQFRKLLMDDASRQISQELFGINVTMLAWQQVLLEEVNNRLQQLRAELSPQVDAAADPDGAVGLKLEADPGITDIAEFEKRIEAKRREITAKLEAEAKVEKERQEMEAAQAKAAAALAAETAPPVQTDSSQAPTSDEASASIQEPSQDSAGAPPTPNSTPAESPASEEE